ncbi:MAG: hypothetical protein KQJ78_02265 [Deltaproteobacteria bacterium]|nr:hypothetical protein [Deltaproteobacteria bacterium]
MASHKFSLGWTRWVLAALLPAALLLCSPRPAVCQELPFWGAANFGQELLPGDQARVPEPGAAYEGDSVSFLDLLNWINDANGRDLEGEVTWDMVINGSLNTGQAHGFYYADTGEIEGTYDYTGATPSWPMDLGAAAGLGGENYEFNWSDDRVDWTFDQDGQQGVGWATFSYDVDFFGGEADVEMDFAVDRGDYHTWGHNDLVYDLGTDRIAGTVSVTASDGSQTTNAWSDYSLWLDGDLLRGTAYVAADCGSSYAQGDLAFWLRKI